MARPSRSGGFPTVRHHRRGGFPTVRHHRRGGFPTVLHHRRGGFSTVRHHRRGGFSLLEVMIALGILAFGILGMMAGQLASMKVSTTSREHTLAMKLAEQQMETLLAMTASDVQALTSAPGYPNDPANPIDPDPGDGNPMSFNRRTIIQADTPEAGVMTMTVEVDFTNALDNVQTARVQSFKADT